MDWFSLEEVKKTPKNEVIILDNNKEMLFSTDNLDFIKIKDIALKGSPEIAKVNNSYFL